MLKGRNLEVCESYISRVRGRDMYIEIIVAR